MLKLKLFGRFSLSSGNASISLDTCHSPRVLRALLYLLIHRNKRVSLRDFSLFLREGKAYSAKAPYSVGSDSLVKTTLHRIRALLEPLAAFDPNCTLHCLDGGVWFDPALVIDADVDRFEALAKALAPTEDGPLLARQNPDRAIFLFRSLLSLYDGRFLEDFEGEHSFSEEANRYHTLFISLCEDHFPLLLQEKCYDEVILATSQALRIDPYCESLHFYKIRATLKKGDTATAMAQYRMAERMFAERFRINPSVRLRRLRDEMITDSNTDSATHALSTLAAVPVHGELSWEAFSLLLQNQEVQNRCFFSLVTLRDHADKEAPKPLPDTLIYCRFGRLQYAVLTESENRLEELMTREDLRSLETLPLRGGNLKIFSENTGK